jgi:N-methylhydantoinase B
VTGAGIVTDDLKGPPESRDPVRVLRDIEDRLVSVERARDEYGVVVRRQEGSSYVVDEGASAELRSGMGSRR